MVYTCTVSCFILTLVMAVPVCIVKGYVSLNTTLDRYKEVSENVTAIGSPSTDIVAESTTSGPGVTVSQVVPPTLVAPPPLLHVVAKSGKLSARIVSNFTDFEVDARFPQNEDGERFNVGFYAVIIDQFSGYPIDDAFHLQPWADLRHLRHFLDSLQPGRLVVCLLRKDLPFEIPNETRVYLQKMGSTAIEFLGPGMTWTWVWVKGGHTIAEGVTFPTARDMAPSHLTHFQVELTPKTEFCPEWPHNPHWEKRRDFCSRYERCGDLCDCQKPYVFNTTEQKLESSVIENAVVVMVAHRVPDLYRSLKSLATAEGFNKSRLRVYTQTRDVELEEFLHLADVSLTVTNRSHDLVSTHIARQIVFAFNDTLHKQPDADFIIFLEEDVRVSPDFFVFLNRSAELLREDATLYCVSAHNDLSYPHTSYNAEVVLRAESYPNYGWMVQRSFAEEMVEVMSGIQTEFDWDVVTYYHIRRGRECIIPEVSRSQHFTFGGAHVSQWDARRFYSRKNLNEDSTAVVKNVAALKNETYEAYLISLLDKAYFINSEEISPCRDDFFHLIPTEGQEVLVLFFYTDVDINLFRINIQWKTLAECLGTFSIESREGHHGLYRMRYGPAHFFLIAYPASPYSRFKPDDIGVFNATLEEQRYADYRSLPQKMVYNLNAVDEVFGATKFKSRKIT